VLDESAEMIAAVDAEYRIVAFNAAFRTEFERMFRRRVVTGMSVSDALAHVPQDRAAAIDACSRAIQGERFTVSRVRAGAGGQQRSYTLTFAPVAGTRRGAVIVVRAAGLEEQVREAAEACPYGVWLADAAGGMRYLSPSFLELLDMRLEEAQGHGWTRRLASDAVQAVVEQWQKCVAAGTPWQAEYRVLGRDGAWHYVLSRGRAVRDGSGVIRGWVGIHLDIDEQKKAMDELGASIERLREHLENAPVAVVEYTPDFHIAGWSGEAERIFGWKAGEVLGKHFNGFRWIHEEDLPTVRAVVEGMLAGSTQRCVTPNRNYTKDGRVIHMEWYNSTVLDERGRLLSVLCLGRDLTQQKETQQALLDNQVRLRAALRAGQLGTWDLDLETNRVLAPDSTDALFALPAGVGHHLDEYLERMHPDDRPRVAATLRQAISERKEYVAEYRVVHPNGDVRWLLARGEVTRDETDQPRRMLGAVIDLTTRKQGEEALRRTEERYRVLFDANPVGILAGDVHGNIYGANAALLRMIGYSKEDVESGRLRWTEITPPEWLPLDWEAVAEARAHGVCTPFEKEYFRKDGSRVPVIVGFTLLGEAREDSVAFIVDITDRKRAEQALLENTERLEMAQTAGRAGVFDWDVASGRLIWTEQPERLFGLEPGEFEGRLEDWEKRVVEEDARQVRATLKEAFARQDRQATFEFRAIRPDGKLLWLFGQASIFYDGEGKPKRMIGVNIDITDRKKIEDELRRSNADLSQFAYAVSHDLREPLRMMSAFSEMLNRRYGDRLGDDGREMTDYIIGGSRRMEALLSDLLMYSRIGESATAPGPVDSDAAVQAALVNLAGLLKASGASVVAAEPLPEVQAHGTHMVQLMQNLIGNAVKFRDSERPLVIRVAAQRTGREVRFSVEDNGIGIEPRHQEYVFRMFKRLHPDREGTGIGLALCRKIVESYAGRIWVESEPGKGSTFFFTLPAAREADPRA
jgi:PAS domain S-box-containing protein